MSRTPGDELLFLEEGSELTEVGRVAGTLTFGRKRVFWWKNSRYRTFERGLNWQ